MVRSSGFGSTSCNYLALFRLAFASAPVLNTLTSLHNVTRRPVLQKVRYHTISSAISACKHKVSGSLSLPSRGSFHLSLTVLFAIGHMVVFSLLGWSPFLPSGFHVSRRTPDTACTRLSFAYGTVTRCGLSFNTVRLPKLRILLRSLPRPYFYRRFGLLRFRSPLLSESFLLSFPPGTKMFQFPGFPSLHYRFMQ